MTNLCNLNGEIMPETEARVPVLDRGFLFGDSVYEVMRTMAGTPFGWIEHLERLHGSAEGLALPLGLDDKGIMERVMETLAAAGNENSYVRVIITRGTGTAPNIDLAYAPGPSSCVILVRDLPAPKDTDAHLAIVPRLRMDRRALDPAIKSGNYLNNVLGLREARQRGATDCLFLNQAGRVTEASTSNLYLVRNGALETPALTAGLLSGITRRLINQLCREQDIPVSEKDLTEADVRSADEVFLSSSLRDITPVTTIDGEPVQDGQTGPTVARLRRLFGEFCERRLREVYRPELDRLLAR